MLQTIVEELLGGSPENEFLLANFEFFVFPMVNADGVAMGNYRCNLSGYDLNRCWNSSDCKDKPEILCITN